MEIGYAIIALLILIACGDKKNAAADDGKITIEDLLEAYPEQKLPFTVNDTNMNRLAKQTAIASATFHQFIPDTIVNRHFKADKNLKILPIGKVEARNDEIYLTTLIANKTKSIVNLSVFNKNKFSASMDLLVSNKDEKLHSATIDSKYSIILNQDWMNEGTAQYERTIYAYNNVGTFTNVLTETNVPRIATGAPVLNPIDTFPANNKYSGDYVKGKNNLLSLRDGATPNEYLFFVHFVNEGDEPCGGDLRGEIKLSSPTAAVFASATDPCVVDFTFSSTSVKVKEQGTCGNYRGIKCFFDHTFTRKKQPKADKKKK